MLIIFLIFTFFSSLNAVEQSNSFTPPIVENQTDQPIKIIIEFNCPSGKIKKLGTLTRCGKIPLKYGPVILKPQEQQEAIPTPITKKYKTWTHEQAVGILSIQTFPPANSSANYNIKHKENPKNPSGLIISMIPKPEK